MINYFLVLETNLELDPIKFLRTCETPLIALSYLDDVIEQIKL